MQAETHAVLRELCAPLKWATLEEKCEAAPTQRAGLAVAAHASAHQLDAVSAHGARKWVFKRSILNTEQKTARLSHFHNSYQADLATSSDHEPEKSSDD